RGPPAGAPAPVPGAPQAADRPQVLRSGQRGCGASKATARSVAIPAFQLTRPRTACRGVARSAIAGGWRSGPSTRFPKAAVAVVRQGIMDGGMEVSFLSWGATQAAL